MCSTYKIPQGFFAYCLDGKILVYTNNLSVVSTVAAATSAAATAFI